ncbi:MAG TPA: peptide deformylase, partial [Rhodospirillales bacterium]|nr:peptide deformylase [Rhodospirillales bacterium]
MAILPIIIAPDPRLKAECDPVEKVTPELVKLMDDMLDTMYDAPGIGLSAPQVGRQQQIIVADVSKQEDVRDPYQMINPEILWTSKDVFSYEEGCLSLPEQYADVMRPKQVRI